MIKKTIKIHGTGVAIITPFNNDKNKKIDFKSLEKLVFHIIQGGVNYIVLFGTTSESSSLNIKEKLDIIECIKNINNTTKLPLVLGIGGNYTEDVIRQISKFDLSNFEAILSVCPYYNKPNQIGLYQHFKYLAKNIDNNIIIYNVPSRTGCNIFPDTVINLSKKFENIIGIKEASGNILQAYEIIKKKQNNFIVICGDDGICIPTILGGGNGVISVLAQAIPNEFSKMINLAKKNKIKESYNIYYKIFELIKLLFEEGNPTGIKSLLNHIGLCESTLRLPLVQTTEKLKNKIHNSYNDFLKKI